MGCCSGSEASVVAVVAPRFSYKSPFLCRSSRSLTVGNVGAIGLVGATVAVVALVRTTAVAVVLVGPAVVVAELVGTGVAAKASCVVVVGVVVVTFRVVCCRGS